ncbi:winged helix DNA-binding domain-containing protein [Cryobacterium breve]|uniref:Winged helix DNA-binding domain-containing protein n=1 Tax=Cryobacterium breve TaxID=1259258 RepID=A0ABY7NG25_9MICO|nr:crosslink repair DNA glycosylase YcaQ family protein [Cryobacterium breve]WBM80489.1 winged helix DNA-binding domain-containing protein [Cryobacterium breve]
MPPHASRSDVLRLRLVSHGLSAPAPESTALTGPLAVVERMLAVQAQDLPAATWALGVRSPGTVAADVTAALDAGSIVRSYPMRGTLHLVPATDVRWMLDLTATRVVASMATRQRQLGLDDTIIAAAAEVAAGLLSGGRHLSRNPFLAGLRSAGIDPDGQRGYHLIVSLALAGLVVWGPHQDGQPALALLDEWAPEQRRLDRAEGLAEFLVRYLDGHGPASLRDFASWSQAPGHGRPRCPRGGRRPAGGTRGGRRDPAPARGAGTRHPRLTAGTAHPRAGAARLRRVPARLPRQVVRRGRRRFPAGRPRSQRDLPAAHRRGRARDRHLAEGNDAHEGERNDRRGRSSAVRDPHRTAIDRLRPGDPGLFTLHRDSRDDKTLPCSVRRSGHDILNG